MRIVFTRVSLANVDDKELKIVRLVLAIQLRKRRNLLHKRRSSDAAKLEKDVLLAFERRQRNFVAIEIRQSEIRGLVAHLGGVQEIWDTGLALSETVVVIIVHKFTPLREKMNSKCNPAFHRIKDSRI